MAFSTDVVVTKESIDFPDRCLVCEKDADGGLVTLRANPSGLFGVPPWLLGQTRKLQVPAHEACGARLRQSLFLRNISLVILSTAAVIACFLLGVSKWRAIGIVGASILIPVIWQVIRPPAFEFTFSQGEFKLMFLRREMAAEIAELNDGILEDDDEDEGDGEA